MSAADTSRRRRGERGCPNRSDPQPSQSSTDYPDGLPDGGFAAELPGSVAVGWSESRVKYQPATPTATNKRIEAARATHLPVRLRTVPVRTEPRSLSGSGRI